MKCLHCFWDGKNTFQNKIQNKVFCWLIVCWLTFSSDMQEKDIRHFHMGKKFLSYPSQLTFYHGKDKKRKTLSYGLCIGRIGCHISLLKLMSIHDGRQHTGKPCDGISDPQLTTIKWAIWWDYGTFRLLVAYVVSTIISWAGSNILISKCNSRKNETWQ